MIKQFKILPGVLIVKKNSHTITVLAQQNCYQNQMNLASFTILMIIVNPFVKQFKME